MTEVLCPTCGRLTSRRRIKRPASRCVFCRRDLRDGLQVMHGARLGADAITYCDDERCRLLAKRWCLERLKETAQRFALVRRSN